MDRGECIIAPVTLPAQIGRFRVLGILGQGAMGTVYRGRDEALDRDVALKVMSAGHGADADSRMRFEREAKAAAKLQHPNIVTIYELGTHEGNPFMALELLEGVDLQRAIEAGLRPNPRVTLPIVLQLLSGLGHAHENGIVHRDVKPSNIFLPRGRPVKIMDFGVARLAGGMTTAGMVVGTPNYMSPEQVRAAGVDGRSDLFSAGLILYELVTGEKAYKGDSVVALLYKIAHEDPDLKLLPREAEWDRLRQVLARALEKDPEQRYPDSHAMIADLEHALRDLGGTTNWAAAADLGLLVKTGPRSAAPTLAPAPAATEAEPPTLTSPIEDVSPPAVPKQNVMLIAGGLGIASVLVLGVAFYAARGSRRPTAAVMAVSMPPAPTPALVPGAPASAKPTPATPAPKPSAPPTTIAMTTPPPTTLGPASTLAAVTPAAPPTTLAPVVVETPVPEVLPENAQLERAEDLYEKGRYAQAMAEAKAVLRREPRNARAKGLVEDAEVELVVENRIKEASAALKKGDKDAALDAVKAGLAVKPSDARLLNLWREATRE